MDFTAPPQQLNNRVAGERAHGVADLAVRIASKQRRATLIRLLLSYALIEVALWAPLPFGILFGIAALWYISLQVYRVAGNARSLGIDLAGALRQSWLLGATIALAAAILAIAYFSGTLHRLFGLSHPWYGALAYAVWAFAQEFMLQCFCLPMLRALVSRASALLLAGVLFAVAHLPNPSLTLAAFFGGVAFTLLYVRRRNLLVVALIHAVLGLTLAVSTPEAWFHQLRVGRDFLQRPRSIAARVSPANTQQPLMRSGTP